MKKKSFWLKISVVAVILLFMFLIVFQTLVAKNLVYASDESKIKFFDYAEKQEILSGEYLENAKNELAKTFVFDENSEYKIVLNLDLNLQNKLLENFNLDAFLVVNSKNGQILCANKIEEIVHNFNIETLESATLALNGGLVAPETILEDESGKFTTFKNAISASNSSALNKLNKFFLKEEIETQNSIFDYVNLYSTLSNKGNFKPVSYISQIFENGELIFSNNLESEQTINEDCAYIMAQSLNKINNLKFYNDVFAMSNNENLFKNLSFKNLEKPKNLKEKTIDIFEYETSGNFVEANANLPDYQKRKMIFVNNNLVLEKEKNVVSPIIKYQNGNLKILTNSNYSVDLFVNGKRQKTFDGKSEYNVNLILENEKFSNIYAIAKINKNTAKSNILEIYKTI